jgi:hypothetical protein
MNASLLLNLYPRAWRNRYEAEFRAMLEEHPVSAMEAIDIALGAVDAHLQPQRDAEAAAEPPPVDPAVAARRQETTRAVFFAHLALFIAVMSIVTLVNVFFTPGNWWFLYPLWAWGTVLATHAAVTFHWKGLFGAHLVFYLGANAGLVAINIDQGGPPWSLWPILVFGIFLAAHALVALRGVSLIRAHVVATALGAGVLALVAIAAGFDAVGDVLFVAAQLGVLLAAHWLMRARGWNLLQAHAFVYAGVLTLLLAQNLIADPDDLWVRYPFVMWTVLLAGHALIQLRRRRWSGGGWEMLMLEELGARGETARQRRLVSTLLVHIAVFLTAAVGFVLLDLIGGEGSWAAWPIGVWYVLLAFHAGYVISPRRWLGSLLFGWVATSAGLIAIDLATGGDSWWYWPVMWSGVVVATLLGGIWTRGRPRVGAHLLGGLALVAALVVTDIVTGPPAWWFYPVAAIIVTWLVHFFATMDLPRMLGLSSGPR